MCYSIKLSNNEMSTLGWAANRGYFPTETYDAMHLADGQELGSEERAEYTWIIPEHAAWAILMHREEDPHSLYTCLDGELLQKLIALENSIV